MSNHVYICRWRHENGLVRAWVESEPTLIAEGDSFEEASEELQDLIMVAKGGDVPALEFREPYPVNAEVNRAALEIVSVCGNAWADGPYQQPGLFEGGYCEYCDTPIGRRTRKPCTFTYVPTRADAAANNCRGGNQLFSEKFIALLRDDERSRLNFLEIASPRNKGKRFYELVGKSVSPFVALRGVRPSSSKCEVCGQTLIYYLPPTGSAYFQYLSERDVPRPPATCFAAGEDGFLSLCMTRSRWDELMGRPGTSQLVSSPIGVLRETDVDRSPDLEIATSAYLMRAKRKRKQIK